MRLPDALAPLRERQFAWFFTGRLVSMAGSMMAPVALTFAVLDLADSASALGQVLAARTIPMVVFLLFGGVLADRVSRSLVMQWSNLLSALTQGAVAWLVITGRADLTSLIVLEAVNGTVSAFTFPAMASVVPQVTPRSHLQQANALFSFTRGGLAIIGPTVAALLVVGVGPGWALAVDAATWLGAAACMSMLRLPSVAGAKPAASMLQELREGWAVFVGHTWLWVVVAGFGVLNAIHAGAWFTLGPTVAKETIGIRGWGLVLSAESVGVLLMTLVMMKVRLRRPLLSGMLGMLAFAVPLLLLGTRPDLPTLMVATFVAGAGVEVFNIGWNLAMQENIDEAVLSRAYSYDALGSFVAMPVGQLAYGALGDSFGAQEVLTVSGIAYTGIVLLTLCSRSVRTLARPGVPSPQ